MFYESLMVITHTKISIEDTQEKKIKEQECITTEKNTKTKTSETQRKAAGEKKKDKTEIKRENN